MTQTVCSIQARLNSTRLPGKVLFSLADQTVFKWVVTRAATSNRIDNVIATIGDRPENQALTELCERDAIEYCRGPEGNLLHRHQTVAEMTDCDILCRVTADCPFVPPEEITRVIEAHQQNEARYTTNNTDEMPLGTAVDAIDVDVLDELASLGETHPVNRLRAEPHKWNVKFSPNENLTPHGDADVAVDTPTDYWRLVDAVEEVGTHPMRVIKYVSEQNE